MRNEIEPSIAAVIAAAGFSRRMGDFKQLLPWEGGTVIGAVVANLHAAGADPVICVVGHREDEVSAALAKSHACIVCNPNYDAAEMLSSYQAGIRALLREGTSEERGTTHYALPGTPWATYYTGTLLALGDQPHIPADVVRRIIEQAGETPEQIVIPSHDRRRGHPLYLPRRLWPDLLALGADESLRDLLNRFNDAIVYVEVDTDAIRRDMDTWVEYQKLQQEYAAEQDVNLTDDA